MVASEDAGLITLSITINLKFSVITSGNSQPCDTVIII